MECDLLFEPDLLDEMIGDNYVKHWAAYEPTIGRNALKEAIVGWRASFPDWNEQIEAIEGYGICAMDRDWHIR